MIWGVEKDVQESAWDPKSKGTLSFDSSFDMSSPKAQQFMLDTCDLLLDTPSLVRGVDNCWFYEFRTFAKLKYTGGSVGAGTCQEPGVAPLGFPVPQERFADAIACFYNVHWISDDYLRVDPKTGNVKVFAHMFCLRMRIVLSETGHRGKTAKTTIE